MCSIMRNSQVGLTRLHPIEDVAKCSLRAKYERLRLTSSLQQVLPSTIKRGSSYPTPSIATT